MQAHNNNIEEYLSVPRTVFVVPVYQRNYDWKEANCKTLFADICRVIVTGEEHFMGTICFKDYSSHERSIIDGQQRLTSITLLLKAIYDYTDDSEIREEIKDTYFYNRGHSIDSEYLKTKLHLNKRDDVIYHKLLENDIRTIDSKLTTAQKESRVYQNYLLFYDLVKNHIEKGGNVDDLLESMRKLTIIELEVQQENPQEIFESLNSTGLDLTNVDLLRNYFLMQFNHTEQENLYDLYWSKIEDAVGVDHMEQFFVDYLVFKKRSDATSINGRRAHINEANLYIAFKDYYKNAHAESDLERTTAVFADLKECADIYKNFIFSPDVNVEKETPIRQKLYYLLGVNDSNKSRSLLLYVFDLYQKDKINASMLSEAVDAITSLTFRAKICKAKGINSQFAGNVMIRLDGIQDYSNFVDSFWEAITIGKGSFAFPSDEEFKAALLEKDLYQVLRSKGMKYMLYMLELHSPFPKGLPSFEDSTLSIEHVMPQTLTDEWKDYLNDETLDNYDILVTRLGNLALTNYNSEMSNKQFVDKQKIYAESNFYYTRDLANYPKWSVNEINRRSEKLASEALKIWKFPAKYQKVKPQHKSLHTLNEDFTQFAYTKPNLFLIQDEEYEVSTWSELLPLVCNKLMKENKDLFLQIASSHEIGAFSVADEKHNYAVQPAYEHITNNIYIRAAKSAYDTLNTIEKLVRAFDEKAGTDYEENIMFSLR